MLDQTASPPFLLSRTCPRAFIRSTSNQDESHHNYMEIQTNSKIDFSSHRVTVAWRQSLMKRHQNTRFFISDMFRPINSKLHMEDNSPGLMTSTQKSLLKITAPPAGYRK